MIESACFFIENKHIGRENCVTMDTTRENYSQRKNYMEEIP